MPGVELPDRGGLPEDLFAVLARTAMDWRERKDGERGALVELEARGLVDLSGRCARLAFGGRRLMASVAHELE